MTSYNLIDVAIYDFGFDKLPPELPFIVLSDDLELDKLAKMTDGILSRIAINELLCQHQSFVPGATHHLN